MLPILNTEPSAALSSDALLSAPADALPVDVFPAELPQPARQLTASAAV